MKLKTINLHNYRCYQNNDFYFGSDITIIIGKNGTGKSTLLSAIRKGMTFVFSNTGGNKLIQNNTNKIEGLTDWDTTFLENINGFQWPTEIRYDLELDDRNIFWKFYKDKYKGKLQSKYYKEAQKIFENYHLNKSSTLPLLGFYGDCYPHLRKENNSIVNGFNKILTRTITLPRDVGYFLWNSRDSISTSWFLRTKYILNIINQDRGNLESIREDLKRVKNKIELSGTSNSEVFEIEYKNLEKRIEILEKKFEEETTKLVEEQHFVFGKLLNFFSKVNQSDTNDLILFDIVKMNIDKKDILSFRFTSDDAFNEGVYTEDSLPMGYQRLIHIIYDIAYRWFILNGSADQFDGLVLIDELELHLHPSLQQTVLERLRSTFPGMQFIVTTHSPIILSNLNLDRERSKIIKLEKDKGKYVDVEIENKFGLDFNSTLFEVMEVMPNNNQVDSLIAAINYLEDKKDINSIDSKKFLKEEIEKMFHYDVPDHIKSKFKND